MLYVKLRVGGPGAQLNAHCWNCTNFSKISCCGILPNPTLEIPTFRLLGTFIANFGRKNFNFGQNLDMQKLLTLNASEAKFLPFQTVCTRAHMCGRDESFTQHHVGRLKRRESGGIVRQRAGMYSTTSAT